MKPCRWGILGTANIARKNWQAIRDAGNATLVAVASRDGRRSAQFIAECQRCAPFPEIPAALDSYKQLIADPNIDAVYLPLPTALRKQWAIRAAEAGKAVLVEKPLGSTAADVEEIIAACERSGVQFMDGVMFMHSRRLTRLREILEDGQSLGGIRRITSQFSFTGDDEFLRTNIRTNGELEPLGCLGDLGWYCVRFSLWVMRDHLPLQVTGRIHSESQRVRRAAPVPTEFSGELFFPDGVSASFYSSFLAHNAQWATVSGTKGYLLVPDFVLPFAGSQTGYSVTRSEFAVNGCQFDMHEGRTHTRLDEPSNNAPDSQEANLFRTFSDLVLSGATDAHWADIGLKTQQVLDACLQSARQGGSVPIRPRPGSLGRKASASPGADENTSHTSESR